MLRLQSTEFPKDRARMDGYMQAVEDLYELARSYDSQGLKTMTMATYLACIYLTDQYVKAVLRCDE